MRLVAIDRAVGHLLARDIPAADPRQMPLLRAGAEITDRYVNGLKDVGIHAVWVHDEMTVGIEPPPPPPPPRGGGGGAGGGSPPAPPRARPGQSRLRPAHRAVAPAAARPRRDRRQDRRSRRRARRDGAGALRPAE